MADDPNLPVTAETAAAATIASHFGGKMSLAMAILLDQGLFDRCKQIAKYMAEADGFTPKHLIGRTQACFFVVTKALTWKLDPMAVANATYETPGGKVGFEGKLVQAILENSGHLEGTPQYVHYGDWSRVKGKFEKRTSQKGNDYMAMTWTPADAKGLGVTVKAKIRGEEKLREWSLDLDQCYPLNSTLWATDPKTQICYTAVRRFANVAAPGILLGVPFDREDFAPEGVAQPELAKDITPTKERNGKAKLDAWVQTETAKTEPKEAELDPEAQREAARQAFLEGAAADDTREPEAETEERRISVTWTVGGRQVLLLPERALELWADKSKDKQELWKRAVLNRNPELEKLLKEQPGPEQ